MKVLFPLIGIFLLLGATCKIQPKAPESVSESFFDASLTTSIHQEKKVGDTIHVEAIKPEYPPDNWRFYLKYFLRRHRTEFYNPNIQKVQVAACPDDLTFPHDVTWEEYPWEENKSLVRIVCDAYENETREMYFYVDYADVYELSIRPLFVQIPFREDEDTELEWVQTPYVNGISEFNNGILTGHQDATEYHCGISYAYDFGTPSNSIGFFELIQFSNNSCESGVLEVVYKNE